MRGSPISLLSHVRRLIQRAPSLRLYLVPALARTNLSVSNSEKVETTVKEGNFDGKALEFQRNWGYDPYVALSFPKRIEGNGALPSVQAYATMIRIVCSWGLDQKLNTLLVELIRKGDDFCVMDLLEAIVDSEEEGKGSLLLLSRVSSAVVKAYANLEMFDETINIFYQTKNPLGCAPDAKALTFLMDRMISSGKTDMGVSSFCQLAGLELVVDAHIHIAKWSMVYVARRK